MKVTGFSRASNSATRSPGTYKIALAHWERFDAARDGSVGAPEPFVLDLLKDCFGFANIAETGQVTLSEPAVPDPARLSQWPGAHRHRAACPG